MEERFLLVGEVKELCAAVCCRRFARTKSLWRQSVGKGWPQKDAAELKFSNVHMSAGRV